jgi:hypothetical protein
MDLDDMSSHLDIPLLADKALDFIGVGNTCHFITLGSLPDCAVASGTCYIVIPLGSALGRTVCPITGIRQLAPADFAIISNFNIPVFFHIIFRQPPRRYFSVQFQVFATFHTFGKSSLFYQSKLISSHSEYTET